MHREEGQALGGALSVLSAEGQRGGTQQTMHSASDQGAA